MLTLITLSGRNKHGQRLCKATCECGNVFEAIHNNIKSGRTKSCGHCGKPAKASKPKPVPVVAQISEQEIATPSEYGTPAYFQAEIARLESAALACEKRRNDLATQLAEQIVTDLDTHKRWNTEAKDARQMRQEIARLTIAKDKAETRTKKDDRTVSEINKDRIKALVGK